MESAEYVRFHEHLWVGKGVVHVGFGSGVNDSVDLAELGNKSAIEGGAEVVEQELDVLIGSPAGQPVK